MAVNLTNADSVLKSYYLDAVTEQLNNSVSPFLAAIEKTSQDVYGKEIRKLVTYGLNEGVGAGTEDGDLPVSTGNKYAQFVTTLKNLYGVIEISDKAIRASENNSGAFVSLLNAEMDGLLKASKNNFGRMLFGNGRGYLATIKSVDGNTVTVDDSSKLYDNQIVDICDDFGVLIHKNVKIDKVLADNQIRSNNSNIPICMEGYKFVYRGALDNEITGLEAIFSEENLYGLDKSQNPWLKPVIEEDVGEISEETIQTVLDKIEEKSGNQPNFIVCSWGVRRALIKLFSQNKRVVDTMELKGGFKAMSYNGIPIVVDRFCPKGTMYLLNTNDFAIYQLCDWEWLQGDDGRILKQVSGKPVYTATLVKYADLLCSCPCGQGKITGITEA